jgi:hypothetical protein
LQKNKAVTDDRLSACSAPGSRVETLPASAGNGKRYEFLTNIPHLAASTIAAIYKSRWQIELFFKFLKQNLKVKGFYGTTRNAVLTQIWIALCMALMVAYLKFRSATGLSFQQILRLLDTNLFLRRDLLALMLGNQPDPSNHHPDQAVLAL